jgi:hypothetical protein
MLKIPILILFSALIFPGRIEALGMVDPDQDFAFLEFEPYPSFQDQTSAPTQQSQFWRLAMQLSFPAGKIGNHQLFGSFKSTLIDRDIVYDSQSINSGILQRYWLSGGGVLFESPKQSAIVMAGLGVNSDFADLGLIDFNTEWIYIHSFKVNSIFNWGLGLDIQQYFHKFQPYPLIFMDWKLSPWTKLKWDADYLEVRQFFTSRLGMTAGIRFNLEFFALKQDGEYEYNSMGLETGLQYALGRDFYIRLKYKELVWGEEILGLPDGSRLTRGIDAGRSLRLNLAYGI